MRHPICHIQLALLAIAVAGCAVTPSTLQPVPRNALSGPWGMDSHGGIYYVKFDTFKTWLVNGGEQAQNRALHDSRLLSEAMPGVQPLWSSDPWRVKDLAYQLLCGDSDIAIRFDDNYTKRDERIAMYLNSQPIGDAR